MAAKAKCLLERQPLPECHKAVRVAALLDMSVRFIREEVKAGRLEGYIFGKDLVIAGDSLRAWMRERAAGSWWLTCRSEFD